MKGSDEQEQVFIQLWSSIWLLELQSSSLRQEGGPGLWEEPGDVIFEGNWRRLGLPLVLLGWFLTGFLGFHDEVDTGCKIFSVPLIYWSYQ